MHIILFFCQWNVYIARPGTTPSGFPIAFFLYSCEKLSGMCTTACVYCTPWTGREGMATQGHTNQTSCTTSDMQGIVGRAFAKHVTCSRKCDDNEEKCACINFSESCSFCLSVLYVHGLCSRVTASNQCST